MRIQFKIPAFALIIFYAVVLFLCFWPFRFSQNSAFWERSMDACHIPLFGTIALVIYFSFPVSQTNIPLRIWKTGIIAAVLAGLVELIQPYTGRSKSLDDFINGVLGIVWVLMALILWERRSSRLVYVSHLAVLCLMLVYSLWPAWLEARGLIWRSRHFPVLGAFQSPDEFKLWVPQGGNSQATTQVNFASESFALGKPLLKVEAAAGDWSGVSFMAGKQDWSPYQELGCDLYNPTVAFTLNVRVDDDGDCSKFNSRFSREYHLEKGWTHLAISVNDLRNGTQVRTFNTAAITRLVFFTGEAQPARVFYLANVSLK